MLSGVIPSVSLKRLFPTESRWSVTQYGTRMVITLMMMTVV